ncbi:unnamed protein product [Caenorhabditis bovis]|uniref:Uncharacterized protein n=1 Tax=Caenorhabditis bovis TaxID=2654633 RepID=A0A8S1EPD0_9PELO|nr:unnamed protein product [Caenorhabditis bovis]
MATKLQEFATFPMRMTPKHRIIVAAAIKAMESLFKILMAGKGEYFASWVRQYILKRLEDPRGIQHHLDPNFPEIWASNSNVKHYTLKDNQNLDLDKAEA